MFSDFFMVKIVTGHVSTRAIRTQRILSSDEQRSNWFKFRIYVNRPY